MRPPEQPPRSTDHFSGPDACASTVPDFAFAGLHLEQDSNRFKVLKSGSMHDVVCSKYTKRNGCKLRADGGLAEKTRLPQAGKQQEGKR